MSWLTSYIHPRRAGRALRELGRLQGDVEALRQENGRLADSLLQYERDCTALKEELAEASRRGDAFHHRAERQEQRLATLSAEAETLRLTLRQERDEADKAMAEITRRLDAIDEMRQSYERRISHLRHALRDALARLEARKDYDDMNELSLIDIEKPTSRPDAHSTGTSPADTAEPSDWLLPLP